MNLAASPREVLLGAAWDEAVTPYRLPGYEALWLRPFSLNALRRAGTMELLCVRRDFVEVCQALPPSRALYEIEALAWLLCEDLDTVLAAMRAGEWAAAVEAYSLPREAWRAFRAEMERVLTLLQASLFEVEAKPSPPSTRATEDEPPVHLIAPGVFSTLAFALSEKTAQPPAQILEWMPACQAFQLAHCAQWGNPNVWTVDTVAPAPEADPWAESAPDSDPGFGEPVEF